MNKLSLILKNKKLVLGRNERQLIYIRKSNLRRAIHIADNKVLTKNVLKKANIPVPAKIKVIRSREELENFDLTTLPKSFVLKPVRGTKGGGIEIFYNIDKKGNFVRADRTKISQLDLKSHCRDIIDGKYSLFNEPDIILIEERVQSHKNFKKYTYKGTPDIRIIVYNKIPIMSYIRIPTRESEGKANLDLGAIGVGIDIAVGKTTTGIIGKTTPIENIPETNISVSGLKIPFWDKILRYAIEASMATGLGFAAIDFLIDKEKGPLIVELNARPGLSIQLSNNDGLRWRLKKAKGLKVKNTEHGIRLGKNLFGGEIEEEVEEITGKQVIGTIEKIKVFKKDSDEQVSVLAKIDTGAARSAIDEDLMKELGYSEAIAYFQSFNYGVFSSLEEARSASNERQKLLNEGKIPENQDIKSRVVVKASNGFTMRPILPLKYVISSETIETEITVTKRGDLEYKAIIGLKDLKKFIIDPSKK